ncbi:MAG: hypothetical protein M2R45_04653 [Verrucomicrobia subdivision 3 bacterium]|nr:hypothetical protein [Limisphaerales bacterium]MCS1417145.1 hypothetical protein [Limisphaerales bacterium]
MARSGLNLPAPIFSLKSASVCLSRALNIMRKPLASAYILGIGLQIASAVGGLNSQAITTLRVGSGALGLPARRWQ